MDQNIRVENHTRGVEKMQAVPRRRCPEELQTIGIEVHEDDRNIPITGVLGLPEERPIAVGVAAQLAGFMHYIRL